MKEHRLKYKEDINKAQGNVIFFVIKLDAHKASTVKISKQKEKLIDFLDNLTDSELLYHFLYSIPIYKGSLCYVSSNKAVKFKSYVNQILHIHNKMYKENTIWLPTTKINNCLDIICQYKGYDKSIIEYALTKIKEKNE